MGAAARRRHRSRDRVLLVLLGDGFNAKTGNLFAASIGGAPGDSFWRGLQMRMEFRLRTGSCCTSVGKLRAAAAAPELISLKSAYRYMNQEASSPTCTSRDSIVSTAQRHGERSIRRNCDRRQRRSGRHSLFTWAGHDAQPCRGSERRGCLSPLERRRCYRSLNSAGRCSICFCATRRRS